VPVHGHLRQIGLAPQLNSAWEPQKTWEVSNRGMRYGITNWNPHRPARSDRRADPKRSSGTGPIQGWRWRRCWGCRRRTFGLGTTAN